MNSLFETMETVTYVFLVLLIIPGALGAVLLVVDKVRGTALSCRWLGWHNGSLPSADWLDGSDGFTPCARCSRCGAEVMRDSQGNWFR